MVTKWSNVKQFFDALQQILEVNSYIYAYHCNVCRNWQLIQWGTILREWKRFDRVQDSINTWNERLLWAYYTFKYGLRVWDFDILFEKNYFLYFCKTIHFQHQQGWGSQKYFWCLDQFTCKFIQKDFFNSSPKLFSLNFECYFSLSVKKMPSVMI